MTETIQPWAIMLMGTVCLCFIWNGLESTRYDLNMKRRLAPGLAQPETAHRFLLWGVASSCPVGAVALIAVMRASGVPTVSTVPMPIIACSAHVTSSCRWTAFSMPDAYGARILGTAPVGASVSTSGEND